MSWSIFAVGKPSEIGQKVKNALASSRSQSNHAAVFDGIEAAVDAAVSGVKDESVSETWSQQRQIVVESSGHVSSDAAQVTLAIRTVYENGPGSGTK